MNSLREVSLGIAGDESRGPVAPSDFNDDPHLVIEHRPDSPLAERYRRLRWHLEQGMPDAPLGRQVIVITSAIAGEGKTTTALNLALAYAEDRRRRTLLVDADLRRPSVCRYFVRKPALGLSEVLSGEISLESALIEMSDSLWVLPAGAPSETPLARVQDKRLGNLIAELRLGFDRIVIDTPPTVAFTDAAVLVAHADTALLVVRAGTTTKWLVCRARESLSGASCLGVVLNDVKSTVVDRYYDRYDERQSGVVRTSSGRGARGSPADVRSTGR